MYINLREWIILTAVNRNDLKNKSCRNCDVKDRMVRYIIDGHFKRVQAIINNICLDCSDGESRKMFISNFRTKKALKCDNDCYLYAKSLCETETGDGLCDREFTPRTIDGVCGKRVRFR